MTGDAGEELPPLSPASESIASLVESTPNTFTFQTSDGIAERLVRNKLSHELAVDADAPNAKLDSEAHQRHRSARDDRLEQVTAALNAAGVSYALIKHLRTPKVMMSDVDLLVPDPAEQAQASRILAEQEYDFYRFRLLAHPRKLMAKQSVEDPHPIDFYPDAIWIRKRVCDPGTVLERAAPSGLRLPAPEDDLYLVATHAFSHFSVTFAELFHGVCLLEEEELDWDRFVETACRYGCADGAYLFLRLLDTYLERTDRPRVPEPVIDQLGEAWPCWLIDRWWDRKTALDYPVQIPVRLAGLVSSLYHTPRVARQSTVLQTFKDLQSHYLATASQLLLGEA